MEHRRRLTLILLALVLTIPFLSVYGALLERTPPPYLYVFSDDFETGTLGKWDDWDGDTSGIGISDTIKYEGSYCAYYGQPAGWPFTSGYIWENITAVAQNYVNLSAYVNFEKFSAPAGEDRMVVALGLAYTESVDGNDEFTGTLLTGWGCYWDNSAGTRNLTLSYKVGDGQVAGWTHFVTDTLLTTSKWYRVTLEAFRHLSRGWIKCYVDGSLFYEVSKLNTRALGDTLLISCLSMVENYNSGGTLEIYVDNVWCGDTDNPPIPIFQNGWETFPYDWTNPFAFDGYKNNPLSQNDTQKYEGIYSGWTGIDATVNQHIHFYDVLPELDPADDPAEITFDGAVYVDTLSRTNGASFAIFFTGLGRTYTGSAFNGELNCAFGIWWNSADNKSFGIFVKDEYGYASGWKFYHMEGENYCDLPNAPYGEGDGYCEFLELDRWYYYKVEFTWSDSSNVKVWLDDTLKMDLNGIDCNQTDYMTFMAGYAPIGSFGGSHTVSIYVDNHICVNGLYSEELPVPPDELEDYDSWILDIFGLFGLALMVASPSIMIYNIKVKKNYMWFLWGLILVALAYAFISMWLV